MDDVVKVKLVWQKVDKVVIRDGVISDLIFNGTRLVIPDGVTSLKAFSCSGLPNITHINLPSSLEFVGENVFANCPNLQYIVAPSSLSIFDKELRGNNNAEVVYVSREKNRFEYLCYFRHF